MNPRAWLPVLVLCAVGAALASLAADRELVRDPHFQTGFSLLEPQPGRRVVYGEVAGLAPGKPAWDLAQWSSRFPLRVGDRAGLPPVLFFTNQAKRVVVGAAGSPAADLSLGVHAGVEYPRARQSGGEPWVHLLVQQDFASPPALGELRALAFHLEARLKHSELVNTNDYSPSRHAAQFFVY